MKLKLKEIYQDNQIEVFFNNVTHVLLRNLNYNLTNFKNNPIKTKNKLIKCKKISFILNLNPKIN